MTILITDDDRRLRFYLKSLLADIVPSCRILEAQNGREMIEMCDLHRPDIAFVDIDMPYLDGLSAIEECAKLSVSTQYVILTGYSTFSYAQRCVSLPVSDYLLKPIDSEKLKSTVEKITESLSKVLNERNEKFQLKLFDSFSMWDEIGTVTGEPESEEAFYYGFVFFIDCRGTEQYSKIYKQLLKRTKEIGDSFAKNQQVYGIYNSKEGALRVIFRIDSGNPDRNVSQIAKLCGELSSDDSYVSCLYAKADSLRNIYLQCEKIEAKQYMRFGFPPANVSLLPESVPPHTAFFLSRLSDLLSAYQDADEIRYKNMINAIYSRLFSAAPKVPLEYPARYVRSVTGNSIEYGSFKAFCRALIDMSEKMFRSPGEKSPDIIDQIKDYVARNYMNNISVNVLADKLDLTPNYLSKVFHEKSGIKFIDYLTEVRIANAKRILKQNRRVSVKDVSIMVGYYSPRHFSNLFQKMTGATPSEFRKASE